MAMCKSCGAELDPNAKFCEACGAKVEQEAAAEPVVEVIPPQTNYSGAQTERVVRPAHNISKRNIVLAIILSFVTCGFYSIYWMIKLNNEINVLADEPGATSGIAVFFLSIITCGIYGLFWMYKMGERCDKIKGVNGSNAILYLVLALVGFGLINYCLMQDTINKAVE